MADRDYSKIGNSLRFSLLLLLAASFLSFASPTYAKSAGETLADYSRLPEKERESKIVEGAKREGKMIYYGTTAVDHIQRVFTEFKKKYPFIEVADYRSGSVNVYNKIATEARAKRYEVDVLDLEPGEVYGITKAGLIDPYLSPSRKGHRAGVYGQARLLDDFLPSRSGFGLQHRKSEKR